MVSHPADGSPLVDLAFIADPEKFRLEALAALLILDTSPEERFDRIVRFSAAHFDVPISLISLVDSHRQWFKARVGLSVPETPREVSFCAHAIESEEIFIVRDALRDERFVSNALVTGDPFIRFYAGAPISTPSGARIGTLCIIDRRPRELSRADFAALDALRLTVNELLATHVR